MSFRLIMIFLCLMGIFISPAHSWSSEKGGNKLEIHEDYFPSKAYQAIKKSQGVVRVEIPYIYDSKSGEGRGFLVNKEGWIITAAHIFSEVPKDVLRIKDRIKFADIPASLEYINIRADIAFLKIDEVPQSMEPIIFSNKEEKMGTNIFASIFGYLRFTDRSIFFEKGLTTRGTIAGFGSSMYMAGFPYQKIIPIDYIYVLTSVIPGFSGSFYVNSEGECVGMSQAAYGGYTILLGAKTIQSEFDVFYQRYKELQAQAQEIPELKK